MSYRTTPEDTDKMPSGIPYIIGNEAAERFSFYGMKAILAVFMTKYLWLMDGQATTPMSEIEANITVHQFNTWVYLTPFLGALLADLRFGKYRVIFWLSLVYCLGHACLAAMGSMGSAAAWLVAGLALIVIGSGGIKPCVSAHVGDQFGKKNQNKLTTIYNIFYFSINLGAFISSLLTPWLLEWYGPHLAFGIPGVLMAIATLLFWMGRKKFAHLPAKPSLVREAVRAPGFLRSMLHIASIFAFVTFFWALFDQTGSSWVFQAQDMDRNFLGVHWLESQIQAFNPILILLFIPLFTFVIYPTINKVFPLTPLRKIGIGLFTMVVAFSLTSLIQEWIDAGKQPSIAWQLLAYALLTAAEVMVSIVSLEFAYTQAPKNTKSIVMSMWLAAVALGNFVTTSINKAIYVEDPLKVSLEQTRSAGVLNKLTEVGYDQQKGTKDDLIAHIREGKIIAREFSAREGLTEAATQIIETAKENQNHFPSASDGQNLIQSILDPWNKPLQYKLLNRYQARISSNGPDSKTNTKWDVGILIHLAPEPMEEKKSTLSFLQPEETWLSKRKKALGLQTASQSNGEGSAYSTELYTGGVSKYEGAPYFWLFTYIMLGVSIIFIPFALIYKYKKI